jgi:signal transduction histidine kinase
VERLGGLTRFLAPAVLGATAVYVVVDTVVNVDEHRGAVTAAAVAMAACVLLLARTPFYAALGVFLCAGVMATINPEEVENDTGAVFVAFILTSWWVGRFAERRLAPVGLIGSLVASAWVNAQFSASVGDYFWVAFFMAGAWVAGFVISERTYRVRDMEARAARLQGEQERLAQDAVAAERQRIARELHDVVAHSVSVMTVQAGAVRRLLRPDQERERAALAVIEATGREALTEMRRLVGLLKDDTVMPEYAPQPGLASLDVLLGTVREAGLPVELTVDGTPRALAPGLDLTAYRVVQESLTNALKYAGPAHAWVTVRWRDHDLEVEVANDGHDGPVDGDAGHGLAGMRERVALYGGRVESGPRDGGGFVVRARLPVEEAPG